MGKFQLEFYHANYPEGVRDKNYELVMLERGNRFIIAISREHNPSRTLEIYNIDWSWMNRHFSHFQEDQDEDIQTWLSRNV